jgi:hypothetical protein
MQDEDDCDLTSEYPIDTDSLVKGSTISAEVIEKAFGVKRGTDAYGMAAMRAVAYISRRFLDRGEVVTITQRKHDLVVLTDEEVPAHNARLFRLNIRRAARAHGRMLGSDRSLMSNDAAAIHDRSVAVQGAQLQAISKVIRETRALRRERQTPGLVSGRKKP